MAKNGKYARMDVLQSFYIKQQVEPSIMLDAEEVTYG